MEIIKGIPSNISRLTFDSIGYYLKFPILEDGCVVAIERSESFNSKENIRAFGEFLSERNFKIGLMKIANDYWSTKNEEEQIKELADGLASLPPTITSLDLSQLPIITIDSLTLILGSIATTVMHLSITLNSIAEKELTRAENLSTIEFIHLGSEEEFVLNGTIARIFPNCQLVSIQTEKNETLCFFPEKQAVLLTEVSIQDLGKDLFSVDYYKTFYLNSEQIRNPSLEQKMLLQFGKSKKKNFIILNEKSEPFASIDFTPEGELIYFPLPLLNIMSFFVANKTGIKIREENIVSELMDLVEAAKLFFELKERQEKLPNSRAKPVELKEKNDSIDDLETIGEGTEQEGDYDSDPDPLPPEPEKEENRCCSGKCQLF